MRPLLTAIGRNVRYAAAWIKDYAYVATWQLTSLPRPGRQQFVVTGSGEPVIVIPGIYENWRFMQPVVTRLQSEGYQVHAVTKLGYNAGPIEKMAEVVTDYMKTHGLEGSPIVAHSKGGLIAKYMLVTNPTISRRIVAVNTPFNGSLYAGLFLMKQVRVFSKRSRVMKLLAASRQSNERITSLYSRFDPHIPEGSRLEGATNRQFDKIGHFSPIGDDAVLDMIARELSQ